MAWNKSFTHDDTFVRFVTESKDEHDRLIAEDCDNIVRANRSIAGDELHAAEGAPNVFQVENYPMTLLLNTDSKLIIWLVVAMAV